MRTSNGMHWNIIGTPWEPGENTLGTDRKNKTFPTPLPPNPKEKRLLPSDWLHEILISKHFQPELIHPFKEGGGGTYCRLHTYRLLFVNIYQNLGVA